ncbi:MAG: TRAFs-binding domain-containing protein [Desulfobacterales bacterium]|nr:TRAFs-binding domain-containing protein [Desulfobacterales bacterium]
MNGKKPLCFVLMPFGKKPGMSGQIVDFDAVYEQLIADAIRKADLKPVRADEELGGGIIHTPMFERLLLCDYAVADLTTANANVFYELGVRHAARPRSTVLIFAEGGGQLPFDVHMLRALPYKLGKDGTPAEIEADQGLLIKKLLEARDPAPDSPLYQLLQDYPEISHEKTDVFRKRVTYSEGMKQRLADARLLKQGAVEALRNIEKELEPVGDAEAGVLVDLFLSYRAVKAWSKMIELVDRMSLPLRESVLVQEQLGFALNRNGNREQAESVLTALIDHHGPSSETYGILGRVYKDHWEQADKDGNQPLARGMLNKAIDAYRKGFEADWRDAYPGVNAVTLMELKEPPDPERFKLLPVVSYAVDRKIAAGRPDYWDFATRLELAVLAEDEDAAEGALADALPTVKEAWMPETTIRNLRLIRETREKRKAAIDWALPIEEALAQRMQNFTSASKS